LVWDQEAGSSNLPTPTIDSDRPQNLFSLPLYRALTKRKKPYTVELS